MSCNVRNIETYPKLSNSIRNRVGNDDKLYSGYVNAAMSENFAVYAKDKLNIEVDLNGDMRKIMPALEKYYNYIHPDVRNTALNARPISIGSFTSVEAREFAKRHVGSILNDFYYQANVKLGIGKEFTFDKYIKSAKTRVAKEFNERYKELQERVKNEKGFKDILAKHSQDATPIAGMLKVVRKYGNNQDINLAALFEEINDPSSTILSEVFRDSRLAPLKQDFKEEILELSNADEETSDSNEEDTTTQANDDIDNYINSLNQKLGDYASFIQHVDGFVRSYFNGLKKLDSTNLTNIQYDKSNPLGVSDTMNNDECCLALFTYGDFTSVDKMIASIKLIANNLDGFKAFATFAEDLTKDKDFANYIYTNFGKTIISKLETVIESNVPKTKISNKSADRLTQLTFDFINSIKTSALEIENISSKAIQSEIKASIDLYKGKLKSLAIADDEIGEIVKLELNNIKYDIKNKLYEYLNRYYPTISSGAIASYIENNKTDGDVDTVANINNLLNILISTINGSQTTQVNYNSRQAEINAIYAYNKKLLKEADDTAKVKLKSADHLYANNYLSDTSTKAAINLAEALQDFELVKTSLNARNVHGNNSSSVINNSMFTNIINTLKSDVALNNYGQYKFKSRQYDFSNIMMEQKENGKIINYGLFRKEGKKIVPTEYAKQLLQVTLYDGASDLATNNNAVYSEMSKGDYVASAFINFFNVEENIINNEGIKFANYFSRIPSDAPKTFVIKAPKYSTKDLFKISNPSETRSYITDKIKSIQSNKITKEVGMDKDYYGIAVNEVDESTILDNLTSATPKNIYLPKSVAVNESKAEYEKTASVTFTYTGENGSVSYVMEGTYSNKDGKRWLRDAKLVGLLEDFSEEYVSLPVEVYNAVTNHYTELGIKDGIIKQSIDRTHPVFRQFQNMFKQELTDAAVAIDKFFVHNNGVIELNEDMTPKFKDGYDNTANTDRKIYEVYHRGKGKHILEKTKDGRYKLTGKVFSSDKFTIYDLDGAKALNFMDSVLGSEKAIDFLYGGVTNSLQINTANGSIDVKLNDKQQASVDAAIEEFILKYVDDAKTRIEDYNNFIADELKTKDNYIEFALNYHLMYNNFNDLFEGNAKFYKDTQTFLKRAKEVQGSGVPYGLVNYDEALDANRAKLDSALDKENIFIKFVDSTGKEVTRKVEQFNRFNAVTVKNTIHDSVSKDRLVTALVNAGVKQQTAENMMEGYNGITVNDAQSYITFEEWIRRTAAKGELKKYRKLIEAINDETKPIDDAVLTEWVQVQKNFYYDHYYNEELGVHVPRQIKNAEFVLIPRFIKGTELEDVYNIMSEKGIDQLNTAETSKAAQNNILTLWDNDGKITSENLNDFINNVDSAKELFNYNYLYKQQDTAQHMDAQNKAGIQIMKKILDNIDDDSPLHKNKDRLTRNYVANIKESFIDLMEEFNVELDKNGSIKLDRHGNIPNINNKLFYDRLLEEAERLGLNSNMLDYLTLRDDVAEPLMPNYMSIFSTKLESIAQSMFNSRVTRQKLPGFHAAQVSNIGFKAGKNYGGAASVGINADLKYHPEINNGKAYIEVMIPKPKKLAHLSNEEALRLMRENKLDEFIGYRIPTEGKQSIAVMKVVAFTDSAQGSTIVVPDDWVAQTGADFDIDSIYGVTKEFYVTKNNKIIVPKYHNEHTKEAYYDYVMYNVDKKLRSTVRVDDETIKEFKKTYRKKIDELYSKQEEVLYDRIKDLLNEESEYYKEAAPIIRNALKSVDKQLKTSDIALPFADKIELYMTALETALALDSKAQHGTKILDIYKSISDIINLQQSLSNDKYEQYKETIGEEVLDFINETKDDTINKIAKVSGLKSFEDFSNSPIEEVNSRIARNNQIADDMLDILRSSASLEENLSRSNFKDIIDARDAIVNEVKNRRNSRTPYNFFDQADYQEDVMSGAKLKAFSVTRDTFCSVCNTVKPFINIDNAVSVLYYEEDGYTAEELNKRFGNATEKEVNGKKAIAVVHRRLGWSEDNKNVDGKLITAYSSQTTAHILDAVKEGSIPNVNDLTFAVYKTFPDMGSNYKTGVTFIMQPAVARIVEAYNKNKSIYNKGGNFNPIHTAIKEIAKELGLEVTEYTPINQVLDELNKKFGYQMKSIFNIPNENFEISTSIGEAGKLDIDSKKLIERLESVENNNNRVSNLIFDLGVILQYNRLNVLAKHIGDVARVTNPDKFGAKQTIYATNKVFDDIQTIVTDLTISKILFVPTEDGLTNMLETIYPDVRKGLNGYLASDNNVSTYPSLHAFLKYSTATSIKINQTLFRTESVNFKDAVYGIANYIVGNITEDLYKNVKNYILSNIYNSAQFMNNTEEEISRIYGYGKTPIVDFQVDDINAVTDEEMERFNKLSPAQKVYWIQQNFRDSGVFKHLRVNLFNEYQYRRNKASQQTISYPDNTQNIESVLNDFEQAMFNNNPIVKSTAVDLIRYAIAVEGFKMKRDGISKIIKNSALYTAVANGGTGFINDINDKVNNINYSTLDETYNNFIRSHSTIKQIPAYRNKKVNKRYEININAPYGIIVFNTNDIDSLELAKKTKFVSEIFDELIITAPYVRLTTGKTTTLYKVTSVGNNIYAYPLNLLEENENSKWSANTSNNIHYEEEFYKSVIDEAVKVNKNIEALSEQFREQAKEAKYKNVNQIDKTKYVAPFDLMNPPTKHIGGFKQVVEHIEKTFNKIDSPVSTWVRSMALTEYIPIGETSIQTIGNNQYLIKRINMRESAISYLKTGKLNREIKEIEPSKRAIIEKARETGLTTLSDVFNITPFVSTQNVNIENNEVKFSTITEDPVIELGNKSIHNMRRRGSLNSDRDANKAVNNLREKGIEANNYDAIRNNQLEVIRTTAAYVENAVKNIKNQVDFFFTDEDGVLHSINDSKTIEYIKKNPAERERYIKTILDASTFGANYDIIKNLDIDAQDDNLKPYLNKIKNNIQSLENSVTISNARERFFLEYLYELSDNPLIQSDIITLLDGYNNVGFFESYISDIQETSVPLIQVVMKEVMANIRASEFKAKERVKEFNNKMNDIKKRANANGKSINFGNIIDPNGKFIQSYSDELIQDIAKLRDDVNQAIVGFGKGSLEHLRAVRKYNKWKLEHTNQPLLDDYYQRKLDIENAMFSEEGEVDEFGKPATRFNSTFVEYKKLEEERNEILNHIVNGTLDENYKAQLDAVNSKIDSLSSIYDSSGMEKPSVTETGKVLGSIESAIALNRYLENMKKLREEYFDKEAKFGFQEQLDRTLNIIKSYERRDGMGRLTVPIELLMEHDDYRAAKEWLHNNATHVIQGDLRKALDEAFNTFKEPNKIKNSRLNSLSRKNDAYDELGVINGNKFSEEDITKLREEQLSRYHITENAPYSDTNLIKSAPTDDTIYTTAFYKGMVAPGTSNRDRLDVIADINSLLQPYYDTRTKTIESWNMSREELTKLAALYDKLKEVSGMKKSSKLIAMYIQNNVEFVTDDRKYALARNAAKLKGEAYFKDWVMANTEEHIEEKTGKITVLPNRYIYGYAKPKAHVMEKYTDRAKTSAARLIANNVQFVPTQYYYDKLRSMNPNSDEFKKWYNDNHVYNPYTHVIEPLKVWTKMEIIGRADESEWIPRYNQLESAPNPEMINPAYKPNVSTALNYKTNTGYDNKTVANEYELEAKEYMREVLTSLVKTDKAKKYIESGNLPSKSMTKDHDVAYYIKEFAKSFGFINDGKINPNWTENVDYAYDYTIDMPMLQQLGNKNSRELKPIPKRLENETDEEYAKTIAKVKEDNEKIKADNAKIHQELLDNNWEEVFQEFILNASHYNSLQENKYLLFLGLQQLRNMKMYKTREGVKSLLKDRKRSNDNDTIYHKESPKHAEALYENSIRRILYEQFKKPQGAWTKTGNILQNIASAKYMMFNVTGGLANVMYGSTQIFMERFAKEYFNHTDWETGKLMWINGVPSFFANMYSDKSYTLSDGIIKLMNVVDFDRMAELPGGVDVDKMISRARNLAFSPQTAGEHFMQNTAMFAMMNSHRVYTDNSGKLVIASFDKYKLDNEILALKSVIGEDAELMAKYEKYLKDIKSDANQTKDFATFRKYVISEFIINNLSNEQKKEYINKKTEFNRNAKIEFEKNPKLIDEFELRDGVARLKPDSKLGQLSEDEANKMLALFKGKVISVNKKIHGVYDRLGAARIESEWWGGMIMQYHKHLYPGFMKRYRRKGYFNEERQTIEKGSYWALYDFIATPIKNFKNDFNDNEYTAMEGMQNLMKNIVEFSTHFKLNYNLLPDNEKAAIRRSLGELLGVMSAVFISIAARLIDDDDEEGLLYNLCIYQADRLASESLAYTLPGAVAEAEKLWSSPVAATTGVEDLLKAAGTASQILIQGSDYDPNYKTGLYAGENKIGVMLKRQIPIYRSFDRLNKLEKNNKYYKLSDNILSVVPIQDIVDWIEE